ncbi:MAG: AAA family ATPase [Campylobacterota bacterium]|nr:AAA family ATPase [Campylobacterota bacterium]
MALQKLPIGIQTFKDIREENYIYIDKTDIAYDIIDNYRYVFLSRPRRFGKSLFLDTLKNIFEGNKKYFSGLSIEDKWDWDIKYPVIKISFDLELRSAKMIRQALVRTLKKNQDELDVKCEINNNVSICFQEFIQAVHDKYNQKVVVLIDEYDKAILDNLDQMDVAGEAREIIKGFYTVLKGSDEYLKFVFLTGVSKFSKASIFSGLNMLTDISLNKSFGNICGYTHNNLLDSFHGYFKDTDMLKVQKWYNGYNFLKDPLYNPFDILQFLGNNKEYKNYWFSTSTPTYLIKLIEKNNYFLPNLSNITVGEQILDSFDIDNIDLEVILYQAGYLTIEKQIEKRRGGFEYKLKIPNKEVQQSLSDHLIDALASKDITKRLSIQDDLYDALEVPDMDNLELSLKSMFDSIPYNNFTNNEIQNYEGFYASAIFIYLQSLGVLIESEKANNKGRIDLIIHMEQTIYIVEFKIDGKENALEQIKQKGYANQYLSQKKDIYLVGIHFDVTQRNISNFEWEKV